LFFSGTNHLVVIGIGRGVDGVEDVAVKGASAAWASYWAGWTGFGLVTLSLFFFLLQFLFFFVLFCVLNFQTDI
jgi:hypothetical protein